MATKDTRVGDRHKGDPTRAIRASDDLWAAVKAKAEVEGVTLQDLVKRVLAEYVGDRSLAD